MHRLNSMNEQSAIRLKIPVTVVLEKRIVSRSFWQVPSWYLHTVAVGADVAMAKHQTESVLNLGSTKEGELFGWPSHQVTLYKDACERYWHALIGDKPLIYVVCREEDEDEASSSQPELSPVIVTIDYDEATACAETDAIVLSTNIPPELYRYMESFVLQHYKPAPFKKRKRRNWSSPTPESTGEPSGRTS